MRVILTGGGTGGHIMPLVAVYNELILLSQETNIPMHITFIGPKSKITLPPNIHIKTVPAGKFRRYFSLRNIIDIPKIFFGIKISFFYFIAARPDVIFSKGGYGSIPAVIAGWLLRVPIILHESDTIPGLANKITARFVRNILVSFPGEYPQFGKSYTIIGNPVRDMRGGSADAAKRAFGLSLKKPVLLILGGSQGAQQVNALIEQLLPALILKYEIIHQVGEQNVLRGKKFEGYRSQGFFDKEELKNAYAVADLIISRAGAGIIFEIALIGKPSILIPLMNAAGGHQEKNALVYKESGATEVLINPSPQDLQKTIDAISGDKSRKEKMSKAAKNFARPEAAREIAEQIFNFAG